jgi:HlyD family secretion protein
MESRVVSDRHKPAWIAAATALLVGLAAFASAGSAQTNAWVAAAPGRVEPGSGEVKVGTSLVGRIAQVLVKVDDEIDEGDLLIRIDDDEHKARLTATEANADFLRRDRGDPASGRADLAKAEDNLYAAEREWRSARYELDDALVAFRNKTGPEQAATDARKRLKDAVTVLNRERDAYAKAQAKLKIDNRPTQAEARVTQARAEVTIAAAVLEKTRIRSPITGTVLQLNAKSGEMVAPTPELPLVMLGDMSVVQVKAEVDEVDIGKIKVGQRAFVKNTAYGTREFNGRVSKLAPTLAPPKITSRGPRRQTDVEVLEVTIDLDRPVPLVPGMRVDAFFRN